MAYEDVINTGCYPLTRVMLTISDIERLAKAGVTMTFREIAEQITADPPLQQQDPHDAGARALLNRWYMNPENDKRRAESFRPDFEVATARHGDTVYAFVSSSAYFDSNRPSRVPVVLEDDVHLFPSDMLLAKIHLWLRTP